MIRFKVRGLTLRLHLLSIMMVALAYALGAREELLAVGIALSAHEFSHFAAARMLHVRVEALDLMPFGGALTMENPYRISRWQLLGVSLAGPACNLVGLFLSAALAWWNVLPPKFALELIRANVMLMAFNLLPALPLDGGRAVYALLQGKMGRKRALNALVISGYALAGTLIAASIAGFVRTRQFNLALVFAAIFLIASGSRERHGASRGEVEALAERIGGESRSFARPTHLRVFAVDEQTEAIAVLRALNPREEALLAVYRAGTFLSIVDSRSVERALLREPLADRQVRMVDIEKSYPPLNEHAFDQRRTVSTLCAEPVTPTESKFLEYPCTAIKSGD